MCCDIEMNDWSSAVQKNNKAVKVAKHSNGNGEKIDAGDVVRMIREKCLPGLRWRFAHFDPIFGDDRFSKVETKQTEFCLNPRCAPRSEERRVGKEWRCGRERRRCEEGTCALCRAQD